MVNYQNSIPKRRTETHSAILRVNIDFRWSAYEIALLFRSLQNLNNIYDYYFLGLRLLDSDINDNIQYGDNIHKPISNYLRNLGYLISLFNDEGLFEEGLSRYKMNPRSKNALEVKEIKYASPGFTDLIGVSGIIGHIKDILIHYFPNKLSREKIRIKQEERIKLQIENYEKMGFSKIQIQKIILLEEINIESLKDMIESNKISSIELKKA